MSVFFKIISIENKREIWIPIHRDVMSKNYRVHVTNTLAERKKIVVIKEQRIYANLFSSIVNNTKTRFVAIFLWIWDQCVSVCGDDKFNNVFVTIIIFDGHSVLNINIIWFYSCLSRSQ